MKNKREKGWEMCLIKRKRRREKIGGTRSGAEACIRVGGPWLPQNFENF